MRIDGRHRPLYVLLVVLIFLSGCTALPIGLTFPPQLSSLQQQSRIGAVESFFRPVDALEAGIGFERIIFEWRYVQPNGPDDWDTSSIPDTWLNAAQVGGRSVIGLIKNAPHWATGSDLLGAPPLGLALPLNDPGNYWAAFVRKLVSFYSTRWGIHHWIIYNEPDIRPYNTQRFEFAGSVTDYYKIVKAAYQVAHATDSQAVIHLAGLTYWQDVVFNRNFYLEHFLHLAYTDPDAKANNLFFDVLTVHVFDGTDWVWYIPRFFENLVKKIGFTKPIWIDELNARVTEDSGYQVAGGANRVTPDQQASFIIQGVALGFAAGVERVEIYKLNDNDPYVGYEAWGLIRGDGTRRPGYYALKTAIRYLSPTITAARLRNDYATLVTMVQPGRTVYVIWNRTYAPLSARIKSVDGKAGALQVSMTGTERILTNDDLTDGAYKLVLPPCSAPCFIQGEPQILVQTGQPQDAWIAIDKAIVMLKP